MTFYEVRAKSIINRVPSQSRLPFDWTVNPYRGCTHACTYCLSGDTPILMADGRTTPLAQLAAGDEIYGTVLSGKYRRYVLTRVLAHWSTVQPAYRITLADGTTLVAGADHRFLTDRGWKHVTGRMTGQGQRPHLTTGNKLMGTGQFARQPQDNAGYRNGYLCGILHGNGRRGHEIEGLDRARRYLAELGLIPDDPGTREFARWPRRPTADWRKGFLAGMFDGKGSCSYGILRIGSTDTELTGWLATSLGALDFKHVVEDHHRPSGLTTVRLLGGLAERLRFFHTVDPAVTRKRAIDGTAVKSKTPLGVVKVEPLGVELPLYDITTETGDFIANGVVSHNCFARHTHSYLDLDTGHDFDSRIIVKVNAGELLRKELAAPRWRGAPIAMGTNVDCYQRAEGRYGLMREILAALRDVANPFSILTKGTLVTRDLDLLRQADRVTRVGVSMSIGFVNEELWRSVEPGTPSPRRRLDTVRQLADAGFAVGVLMAPILPLLTDTDESIDATVRAIVAAGAASVTPIVLHLRRGAREWYLAWLRREFPELWPRYRQLYGNAAYLGTVYQREVLSRVRQATERYGLPPRPIADEPQPDPPPTDEQLTLL